MPTDQWMGKEDVVHIYNGIFSSVQFSRSVVSDSLRTHGLQHTRPPCPSPPPGVYSNSCPLNQWCHPTISSSVVPFSSCLQSFPASGSFQMSQLFASGGQSIGVSASTSVLPMNTQDWSPLGWTDWLDLLAVQGTLISSLAPQFKNINSWTLSLLYGLIFRGNIFVSLESWNENLIIQEPHFSIENISWFFSFFVEKQTVPLLSVLCQR